MIGNTAPFMVIETDIWSSGIWSKRIFMSSIGVDGHARLADVADHALVIGVVAAMGRQVEGHRKPLLSGRQIAPVKRIRLLGRREARILADGPGLHHVHRRYGPRRYGGNAGGVSQVLHALQVLARVVALDDDVFRRQPFGRLRPLPLQRRSLIVDLGKIRSHEPPMFSLPS